MRLQTGNWNQLKQKRKGGFTTIEVLVVVVLTLILAGGAVFGLSRWVSWTAFNQQNEAARTLFVAAQNQLTVYGENGRLSQIEKRTANAASSNGSTTVIFDGNSGTGTLLSVKDLDGNPYTSDTIWQNAANGRYKSEIYSIIGTSATYDQYLAYKAGTQTSIDDGILLLYQILEPYVYDTSLLHANICLEFDPADGQVFSLLYSDEKDNTGFTYTESETNRGVVSVSSRQADYRWARMTGYYGVSTLSTTGSGTELKPSLTDVRLENGDLLEMTFGIEATDEIRPTELIGKLNYKFVIYDDRKKPHLQFDLNLAGQKGNTWLIGAKHLVSTEVSRYNEDGQAQSLGEYNFLVWIDNDNHVHVVLDAADVGATTKLYQAAYLEKDASASAVDDLKKTLSFHRFGLDVDNIYYTVQATGAQCKPSAVRTSNTEHAYFGSVQRLTKINTGVQETQKTTEYAIQNARHLYNIRYEEDYQAEDAEALNENNTVTYRLEENIDWAEFCRHDTGGNKDDGLYWFGADTNSARFSLLSERDAQKATPTVFPSIRQLREYAIFTGQKNSGKIYKINGLEITAETNEAAQLYQTEEEKAAQSAGLFLQNYGTISAVKLDRIQVTGGKNVGAFCSVDSGTLKDLTVSNSDRTEQGNDAVKSVITGKENVGGIVGTWQSAKGVTEMTYEKLVNRAEVRESDEKKADDEKRQNFGGIIGSLEAKNGQTVTVQNCKNYGSLTAVHKDTENLGGIVGFAEAEINSTTTLKNCISSLQYPNLTMDDKTLKELLNGKYVGGIIGQSKNVSIENCSTEKEGNTEGYLFGNEYVGGIAGSYTTKSGDGTISGGEKNARSVNELHVLGNQYVGGIVGKNESGTVSNWENRGFVAATTKFAGGIVGSNGNFVENETSTSSAVIQNCTSVVQSSDAVDALRKLDVFHANYVGGIAGYNNGVILNDDATSIVVNVSGGSFVGGVTGYNDAHSQIINYGVGGGTVKGDGAYVGGFVGVNVSRDLFVDENENTHIIQSNPNSVVGDSFVGGTIGANLLLLDGGTTSQKEFVASFSSDNFLGIVQANKFLAGGFIGYNQLLPEDAAAPTLREKLEKAITTVKEDDFSTFAPEKVEKLFYEKSSDQSTFTIQGTGGNQHTNAKFGGIESQIYVGGVIGYNHSETTLKVNNVINQSPVTATSSIENDAEQSGNTYDDQAFTYSYAGGIIGKVGKKTTIDNCRNQDAGEVVTQGTYTGGICEVNEGTIQNCTVSSLGETDHDYVGGIVGLNKQGATIQGCTFEQKTVTGKNYVGGIAAENYGSISGITLNNVTVKANNIAGGIVGENKSGGQITVSSATVEMSASGENIGGIVGVNNGTITSLDKKNNVVISGSVSGKKTVGGIVGSNQFGTLEKFENQAAIKASNGNAGGIAGSNDATIKSCSNRGTVEATKGNAGGIAAVNRNMISGCKNYGEVDAKNGICGGTVAENAKGATVTGCQVLASSGVLTLTGKTLAGGIAGQNSGTISDSTVKSSTITNDADSKGSALGGIAGENTGTIKDASSVGEKNNPVTVLSNAADVNMGGAVGRNYGEMAGGFGTVTDEVYANLKFASGVLYGNVGGVVGANGGTVDQYQFTGTVEGTANNSQNAPTYDPNSDTETNGAVIYGYGGIAGVNGITEGEKEHSGTIYNCTVKTASITGQGDANNIVNVGGAAGVNHLGSTIHRITLSGEEKYSLMNANSSIYLKNAGTASVYVGTGGNSGNFGHVGGIVGLNSGEISDINVDKTKDPIVFDTKVDNTTVFVENYRGHVGGIVGYNRRTGIVKNVATGKSWVVFAVANAQDNGCGGIVGYQASEYGLQNCFNRATVEKTVKGGSNGVGGMIGRMEVAGSNSYVLDSCKNYGDIYGNQRVGGMVGVWKYYGGTVSNCVNYGKITAKYGEGAAGIIGHFIEATDKVTVLNCQNHGEINANGKASAGIMGNGQGSSVQFTIQNCVNTGTIVKGDNSAGICAVSNIAGGSTILNCRNYGFNKDGSVMGGIVLNSVSTKNLTMKNCYGLASLVKTESTATGGKKYYNISITEKTGIAGHTDNYYLKNNTAENWEETAGIAADCVANGTSNGYKFVTSGTNTVAVSLPGFKQNLNQLLTKNTSSDSNNIRYQVFEADDEYLTPDGAIGSPTTWTTPYTITVDQKATGITVSWNKAQYYDGTQSKEAPFHQVEITYYDENGAILNTITETVFDSTKAMLPRYTEYNGKKVVRVKICVRGGVKYVDNNNTVQTSWSQWADVTEEVKDNILPTPKYHLELELVNNSLQYRLYLDNKQDYVNFLKKQGITDEGALNSALSNLKMTVRNRTKTITAFNGMTVASETSTGTWKVTPENQVNVMYLSAVVSDGGNQYGSSIAQLRQSDMWGQSIYTGTSKIADVKLAAEDGDANVGFYGDTMDTLNYLLKIDKKKTSYYMRSELTAVDRELKVPVVVATSQLQVSDTSNTAISTQLSDLPEDLLDAEAYSDLFLRSYPAFMANNVVYMGHTVHGDNNQTTWTKEELAKLYVTEDHHVTTANTGAKLISGENLASGFVIEYGGEDTYSLYYNTLLDYNGKKSVNYKTGSTKTQMKNQVYFYDIDDSNLKKQPTPEVVHTYDEDTDQYLLTWDNDENGAKYNNATYDYRVLGSNETEEGPVTAQITADTVTAQAGTQNTYKNSGNTWDYTEVSAFVSHHGMVDTNGKTQIFPVGAKAQPDPQSLKRRLSQMTKPTVSLHKDASGKTQKDALQYDVKYKALPTAEQPHVGAYEITVERSENDTKAVATYLDNASYNSALEKLKALYAAKKQVSIENRDGEIIYRWTETTQTATIAKTMRLCFDCDTRIITKNLTSVWTFSDVISKKQTIDLNDYDRGEQLEISIRAIPHKMESNGKACPYRRGPKGVVAELTLPDRLEVPSVTNLASDPSYSKTGYMTLEEFANGLKLTYRSNSTYDIDGTYQVAVALYDEKGNHDTSKVSSDAWDADAVKTLIAKDADTGIMSGDLQSGSLTLYLIDETGALLDDYAGKWLKIAMRSVSDNQVSSFWSDEDEASEGTVNYAWIQIPRVQIATPEISDTAQSVTYPITGGDSTVTVKQTVLRMELPDHSDLHRIQIVRSEDQTTLKQDNKEYAVQYLDWIYLEPTETSGEYAVFYATTDPNTVFSSTETDAKKKNSKQDAPVGVKIGVLTEGSTLELPYQVTMKYPGNEAWTISVKSKLSLSKTADGTERVTLLLPDAEQVDIQSPNQDDLHTAQVSLQSLASQKQQSCYANSKINNWWRNGKQTELTELDGYSKLTDSTEKVNATWVEPTDKAYQKDYKLLSGSLKNYRLVYELTSQTGTSTKTQYYISAYGREDKKSNSMESYALVPEKYLNNGTVTIRVAAILPQSNLSSWEDGIVQPLTNQEKTQQNLDKVKDFLAQLQQREQERQQADGNMPAA